MGRRSRIVKTYLLRSNGKVILYVNGAYAERKTVDKKSQTVPLEPQPDASDVLTITRYYSRLRRDDNFQKRVTWTDEDAKLRFMSTAESSQRL